jgi:uncharacterized protein
MSERDEYPSGVPCWVDIAHPDPRATAEFYEKLFGWKFVGPGPMPDGGEYFVARLRGRDVAGVSSTPAEGAPPGPAWNTYVTVGSAEESAAAVTDAGGTVLVEPFDALPAGRMAVVADPAGAVLLLWQARDRQGAQLVNEPSAWSMSILNTRDVEGAKAFYGAVFGWVPEMFGDRITLWRLPGYVGGEPSQPVPRDVIAAMAPMSAELFPDDMPSHWAVDFWIADADAAAATAAGNGGTVIAAPHEAPPFRRAVIADPGGASFSVSQLQLPG